ncbi:MAG: (Fe-S)-binding protein [Dehalococcoidales bacterium]|nr:(Fe-S)-binding protein [Dehalococcoidales bacterium]
MENDLVPPGLTYLADNIKSHQNILGVTREQGARWAQGLDLPARSETIFFAGCGYQYSAQLGHLMALSRMVDKSVIGSELPMRFARFQKKLGLNLPRIYGNVISGGGETEVKPLAAAVMVLRKLGIEPGYLAEDEPCCGAPLNHAGLQTRFGENARQAYQKLKEYGVKRVISIVPYCSNALAELFPKHIEGYDLEVSHFLTIVAENLASLKLRWPEKVKITYHDPCQLVRFLDIVDEPRRILSSIKNVELVEPDWTKGVYATCCGGGGGFEAVFPELSSMLGVNRAQELLETGADIIVTHCPGCVMQLKEGVKELKGDAVPVMDLAEVIAMAMEE